MHHRAIATLSLCILAAAHTGCMTAVAAFQPENIGGETIVITTTEADGESHERVLSPIDYDGRLFVAANHWPRAWYRRALENPDVSVRRNGKTFQVQHPSNEQSFVADSKQAAAAEPTHTVPILRLAKQLSLCSYTCIGVWRWAGCRIARRLRPTYHSSFQSTRGTVWHSTRVPQRPWAACATWS